jgi:hypothetical protein
MGRRRAAVFNAELVFQLAAMGIENIMAGLCQYHRQMPTDHTLSGLVAALASVCPLDPDLARRIGLIEAKEDLCSLAAARKPAPDAELIEAILEAGQELADFAEQKIPFDISAQASART